MTDEAIKNYIKVVRNEANKDMECYIGAISEQFQDKLQIVAEVVSGIDEKIDVMQEDIKFIKIELGKKVSYSELKELLRS